MNYYDMVLFLVPITFTGAGGIALFVGMSVEIAVMVGGTVSVAIIGHAMFANPPVDIPNLSPDTNDTSQSASSKISDEMVND